MTLDTELEKEFEKLSKTVSQDANRKRYNLEDTQSKEYVISFPSETLEETIKRTFPIHVLKQMEINIQCVEKQKQQQEKQKQEFEQFMNARLARIKNLLQSKNPLDHIIAWQESHAIRAGLVSKSPFT